MADSPENVTVEENADEQAAVEENEPLVTEGLVEDEDNDKQEEKTFDEAEEQTSEAIVPSNEEKVPEKDNETQDASDGKEKPEVEAEEQEEENVAVEEPGGMTVEEQQVESSDQLVEPSEVVNVETVEHVENVESVVSVEPSEDVEGRKESPDENETTEPSKELDLETADSGMEASEDGEKNEVELVENDEEPVQVKEPEKDEQILEGEDVQEAAKEEVEETALSDIEDDTNRISTVDTLVTFDPLQAEHDRPEPVTPVPDAVEMEGDLDEMSKKEQLETVLDARLIRAELLNRYDTALLAREKLQHQNYSFQHKLADHFRKKKAEEIHDGDKNTADQEQRYLKYMAQLEDLRKLDASKRDNYQNIVIEGEKRCQERKAKVDAERAKFSEFKRNVALRAISARNSKPVPPKEIDDYFVTEAKKEEETIIVRLENIKMKNKMKKREHRLKLKEELAEGLHLIDFEQLKIENQTYNEKIEERNEELLKFRKKITSTVQILTHLKEKLQYVQAENSVQKAGLKEIDATLGRTRDILSRTKQARDALRIDNHKLRQRSGFLGNESLLKDYEDQKDEGTQLQSKLDQLKMRHAELTLYCNQVRKKVEQSRAHHP